MMANLALSSTDTHWNAIFLVDQLPATRLGLLQRSLDKSFAGGFWTGVGGKYEPDEDLVRGAKRELFEEMPRLMSVMLRRFARCFISAPGHPTPKIIDYFTAVTRPDADLTCHDGTVHWIPIAELFDRAIIETTRRLLLAWEERGFSGDPFTLHICRTDIDQADAEILWTRVDDGLDDEQ